MAGSGGVPRPGVITAAYDTPAAGREGLRTAVDTAPLQPFWPAALRGGLVARGSRGESGAILFSRERGGASGIHSSRGCGWSFLP